MKTIYAFSASTLLSLGCIVSSASASIVHFPAPRADSDRNGIIGLSANDRRKYKADQFYYLGKTADGYVYGTTLEDKMPEPPLVTLAEMADRLDVLNSEPSIYGKAAMVADITKRMRAFVPVAATSAPKWILNQHLPTGPLPIGDVPAKVALAPFNNGKPANGAAWFGASLGDEKYSGSDWPKTTDMQSMIALRVKAVRIPIEMKYCFNPDGAINTWVVNNLANAVKVNKAKNVATVLDAHEYMFFDNPLIANFWMRFAPAIEKSIGGPSPYFGIELSNEPGKGSQNLTRWTEPLRATIKAIRIAGYQGYILAGAGDWNNMTFLPKAFAEIERTGGVVAMDPYDRTIYTGHDYWNKSSDPNKTRNDQGSAVNGTIDIAKRYDPALAAARKVGAKVIMSEIGGGISPTGPLPAFEGKGKDGRQLQEEYFAYAKASEDVLIGTWFWMGGDTSKDYRHKIGAGNEHTLSLQSGLWSR